MANQSFAKGMYSVAEGLIAQFGGKGKFIKNDAPTDPITGLGGGSGTKIDFKYFREYYEDKELIENRIINGDAKLYLVADYEPRDDWTFLDSNGKTWTIISTTPIEAQEMNVLYIVHIRK